MALRSGKKVVRILMKMKGVWADRQRRHQVAEFAAKHGIPLEKFGRYFEGKSRQEKMQIIAKFEAIMLLSEQIGMGRQELRKIFENAETLDAVIERLQQQAGHAALAA